MYICQSLYQNVVAIVKPISCKIRHRPEITGRRPLILTNLITRYLLTQAAVVIALLGLIQHQPLPNLKTALQLPIQLSV